MLPNQNTLPNRMTYTSQQQQSDHLQDASHTSSTLEYKVSSNPQANAITSRPSTINGHSQLQGFPSLPPILDQTIAHLPFTHPGSLPHHAARDSNSYEQLEFVGDAYVELMATRLIYQRYKHLPVGRMSQIRELLVKNETLAEYSLAYEFNERATDMLKNIGKYNDRKARIKVLGDIFEAYVAAVILSDPINGFTTVEAWLAALWRPKLEEREWEDPPLDPLAKQELAKKVLGKGIKLDYVCTGNTANQAEGKTWYSVNAYLTGWGWTNQLLGFGTGLNKTDAGSRAAMQALENPLTEKIGAVKREYDERTAAARLGDDGAMKAGADAEVQENGEAIMAEMPG